MKPALRAVAASVAIVLTLGACSSGGGSTSDTVSQPDQDLGQNGGDVSMSDKVTQDARAACAAGTAIEGRAPRIATTVSPITSLVAAIVGDTGATVEGIVPGGADMVGFAPSPGARQSLARADVVFMNGMSLEQSVRDAVDSLSGSRVVCELGTATLEPAFQLYDAGHPKEGERANPYLWTNPTLVLSYLTVIRDVLVAVDPGNGDAYDTNYVALSQVVSGLDAAMEESTATIPLRNKKIVTIRDTFTYLAERYGLELVEAVRPDSYSSPSPGYADALAAEVKEAGVPAMFGGELIPADVRAAVAAAAGVEVVELAADDDLPGSPGDAQHSWWGLMRANFAALVESLGGDASALTALKYDPTLRDRASYPG